MNDNDKAMVSVKTRELSGPALNWMICRSYGAVINWDYGRPCLRMPDSVAILDGRPDTGYITVPDYVGSWEKVGRLVQAHRVTLMHLGADDPDYWAAYTGSGGDCRARHDDPKTAVCRAVILRVFGDTVEIPELIKRVSERGHHVR